MGRERTAAERQLSPEEGTPVEAARLWAVSRSEAADVFPVDPRPDCAL